MLACRARSTPPLPPPRPSPPPRPLAWPASVLDALAAHDEVLQVCTNQLPVINFCRAPAVPRHAGAARWLRRAGAAGRQHKHPPPPPPPRTKWTRRVLYPVLIGHAASLTPPLTVDERWRRGGEAAGGARTRVAVVSILLLQARVHKRVARTDPRAPPPPLPPGTPHLCPRAPRAQPAPPPTR